MYNDWQVINVNQLFEENRWSVVHKLPSINGQNVVNEVVKPLAISLNNNNQFITNIGSSNNLNSTFINNNNLQATTSNLTTLNEQFKDENESNKDELFVQSSKNLITTSNDLNDYTYYLKTDRDVQWVMEVICYGLGLPISTTEHYETVRDCVHIYCEWMYALISTKSQTKLIPYPIRDDPNHYFKRILQHLYNIFVPRISSVYTLHNISNSIELNMTDIISKQALLCHRILRTISTITQDETNLMDGDTWDNLLLFLLAINDVLLAQPGEREDIGTHLCERVITVLFEIWIMACKKCFPTPNYWKTLQHLLSTWRHRPQVIEQWSTVCLVFTQRLVQINNQTVYSGIQQESNVTKSLETENQLNQQFNSNSFSSYINNLIQEMDYSLVSQSWYRFLLIINNPVDLSSPEIISKTKKFSNFATECVVDPRQHPCLDLLPQNFYKAMKGIAQLVDTFLGINFMMNENYNELNKSINVIDGSNISSNSAINLANEKNNVVTPPNSRKIKNISKNTILGGLQSVNKNSSNVSHPVNNLPINPQNLVSVPFSINNCTIKQIKYSPYRPKVNSILKIFGKWLFNAALLNNNNQLEENVNNEIENSGSTSSFSSLNNQNYSSTDPNWNRRNSNDRVSLEIPLALLPENFEAGIAEALGILCRLFSSKQSDEEISPIYYARFFEALKLGLSKKEPFRSQVLSSILINGTQLFKLNISGIDILIPDFLKAFEIFVFEKEPTKSKFFVTNIIDLRRACIKIMLSLLSYPLHFNELPIKDCLTDSQSCISFRSLKPNLVNLMINALHTEKDSLNLQMILGGLIIILEDTFAFDCEEILNDTKNLNKKNIINQNNSSDDSYSLYTIILNSTCHLLMTQKKNDTQVSLAALEVLSQLARIPLNDKNVDEIKRATNCICNYIVNQCSRPPPHHSRDMHSTLVAAYQCLSVWFSEHSYLLKDDTCINTLLEVIELGISGSKSTNFETPNLSTSNNSLKSNSSKDLNKTVIFKTFKELKPASMRVQESAEFLFNCFINQFGCSPPSPCPPECVTGCCDLNELSLLKLIKNDTSIKNQENLTFEEACKNFKYFVSENTILIGFLNEPKNQNCYCLVRSPFGKFCWKMNFQLTADSFNGYSDYSEVSRPKNYFNFVPRNFPNPKNFPSSISKVPLTNIENSIPTLKQIYNKYSQQQQQNLNQMLKIVTSQKAIEKNLKQNCLNDLKNRKFDCKKPVPPKIDDFDSARLIINHLGLMNLEKNRLNSLNSTQLINLDLNNIELFNYIGSLDSLPLRTCDTSFIFYVRKGRVHPQEILNSVCSINYVKPSFLEFLYSLGNPINCKQHYGWTGNLFTSWKGNFNDSDNFSQDTYLYAEHGGSIFDGKKMSIYWADIGHEMAFIVPSQGFEDEIVKNCNNDNQMFTNNPSTCSQSGITNNSSLGSAMSTNTEEKSFHKHNNPEQRSISSFSDETISVTSHNPSENSSSYKYNNSSSINNSNSINNDLNQRKKRKQDFHTNIGCDIKVLIIWLENSEDEYNLPIETLMLTTNTGAEKNKIKDYIAILIHPLKNGLFATKIISSQDKVPMALPIMDGIVISKRILGLFVRLTTLNIYKRRRLDMDNFQLPHVKRRVKIQELSKKFKLQGKEVEFYNSLF